MAKKAKTTTEKTIEKVKKEKTKVPRRSDLLFMAPDPDNAQAMLLFEKMGKDQAAAAMALRRQQVRWLVDQYYVIQRYRIQSVAQTKQAIDDGEPNDLLYWFAETHRQQEDSLHRALDRFVRRWKVGQWLQSIVGIGPIISAGLLCGFDIRIAKYASRFISYCGLDPTKVWGKGQRRPWNARLKTLVVFKAGESFVKTQNNKDAYYGKIFRITRDELEVQNEEGKFSDTAKEILATKNFKKVTREEDVDAQEFESDEERQAAEEKAWMSAAEWYAQGKLPPAHLHARARRKTAKIFISHLHHVMYHDYHGEAPEMPYVFSKPEFASLHSHYLAPPNWPNESLTGEGLKELYGGSPLPKSFRTLTEKDILAM